MSDTSYNYFVNLNKEYEQKVNKINLSIRKKDFKHKIGIPKIKQISLDDMYDILYLNKQKHLNYKFCNNIIDFTNNINKDVSQLLKTLNSDYFDDTIFKKVTKYNIFNRFNPKTEGEILFYNCLRRDIFNQTVFHNHIFLFESKLKDLNKYYNKNCTITFYEDDDLKIIWFIMTSK